MKSRPWLTTLVLVAADLVAISLCVWAIVHVRLALGGAYQLSLYWNLWPLLGFFILAYAGMGLYPGILLTPPDELKRITWSTSMVFVILGAITFMTRGAILYSRSIFLVSWFVTLFMVPLVRSLARKFFSGRKWWGYPVVIYGTSGTSEILVRNLHLRTRLGLKPVAFLDPDKEKWGKLHLGLPVLGDLDHAAALKQCYPRAYLLLSIPEHREQDHDDMPRAFGRVMEQASRHFRNVIIIPDIFFITSMWVKARDIGGILGLETQHKLLDPGRQSMKRVLDLVLTVSGLLVIWPVLVLIALAVKIQSRGPVLYFHERIGYMGRTIRIAKFRTMYRNADQVLENYFADNPQLRAEWETSQKLRHDPRVTPLGRFLRRSSLDELPQLWNVLKGELSLVGPRPIVEAEVSRYRQNFDLYKRVMPGITGLWQISGRASVSYDQRIDLDTYYIRNWSVWFDIYILTQTPRAVLTLSGAY
jgi:Undecaprenyl-phosphate galactose phosphotransferase WbaP